MNDVPAAFEEFISAFNALDMNRFAACLAPLVSLYPPGSSQSLLVEGHEAVVKHFEKVFQVESPAGPKITPDNVRFQLLGNEATLVTFTFSRPAGSVGKRSIVFKRNALGWQILHIHASNTEPHEAAA